MTSMCKVNQLVAPGIHNKKLKIIHKTELLKKQRVKWEVYSGIDTCALCI